ncbi:MAG: HIT family protein [Rhizobiales bacterium]|nr:HIT family protein [Hyphomicrobiales bacterium]
MQRFEYPDLLVRDFAQWGLTLRRHQVTLGALVLMAKSDATAFSDLDQAAFTELAGITRSIEHGLKTAFGYDKINYLMLMMVDPNVHFHIFPRYGEARQFEGMAFEDAGWPKAPNLASGPTLDDDLAQKLIARLKVAWPPH